jgi:predicted nucleotidyltransferase
MPIAKFEELKLKIEPILRASGVTFAAIFGSVARGEEANESDVDILIRPPKDRKFSLYDLIGLEASLKETLKKDVDLVTEQGMSKYMKPFIMRDLQPLYGQR